MTEERLTRAVAELVRKTQDGELKWNLTTDVPEVLSRGSDDVVNLIYTAELEGRNFRIYKRRYREDDYRRGRWEDETVFELFNGEGHTLYKFPLVFAIHDLWDAVQAQTSGAGDLITHLSGSV